jgi:hypothetical protein
VGCLRRRSLSGADQAKGVLACFVSVRAAAKQRRLRAKGGVSAFAPTTFDLFEDVDARAITIQREQYGGIVHLFIGTRCNPSKNTFMTLTCTNNRNINHQGLTSLFFFDSASCLTFVATLSRSCRSSALVVVAIRQCLHLEDLRRRRGSPT